MLTLTTAAGEGGVRASVADTGPGIPAGALPRIFEPFYTTKAEGKGTGLGLPISIWIVQKTGGRIDVESREGAGATFHVMLPAAPALPGAAEKIGGSHEGHPAAARG